MESHSCVSAWRRERARDSPCITQVANKYVNFTVSTIFKCSKALPTMALMVVCGKRYTCSNVAAAATMALSAFCFAVGARQADDDFNYLGVMLNGLYLLFQALQVALQDTALRDHGASVDEMMLYANGLGLAALGTWALADGELFKAVIFFAARPNAVLLLAARNATFYAAVRYYTAVVKDAGGVAAVTVGIVRKILTVAAVPKSIFVDLHNFLTRRSLTGNDLHAGHLLAPPVFEAVGPRVYTWWLTLRGRAGPGGTERPRAGETPALAVLGRPRGSRGSAEEE